MELHLRDVENFRAFSRYAHEKRGAVGKSMMEDFRNLPEKEQKVMFDYISRRDGDNPGKIAYTTPQSTPHCILCAKFKLYNCTNLCRIKI